MPRVKPSGQPPKVWKVIEKTDKDGKPMKFTIQEIPEDRYEDAVQHMCTYFLADEPMCKCLNAKNDPSIVQDERMIVRKLLAEGISIAAFIDNPNGGKPIIAGMNVLGIDNKNEKDYNYEFKSENFKNTSGIVANATKVAYERYHGIDKFLYAVGLSVDPAYRGYGLGKDILKIRDLIGPMYGVPVTSQVFSSIFSQRPAAEAGFEEFSKTNFSNLVDKNGKEYFPGISSKEFKVMGKRLP
ncbi:uncharacterized protein [Temnothorax nylanderi]|uniref:uncharacterized protein n=1 Tax=Temnothorax nylanderi TaxID=102681 RepID=UPI003A891751